MLLFVLFNSDGVASIVKRNMKKVMEVKEVKATKNKKRVMETKVTRNMKRVKGMEWCYTGDSSDGFSLFGL